jgi:phosphotriesterase-related protein
MKNNYALTALMFAFFIAGCSPAGKEYIMTINGPVPAAETGISLTHEHILVDFIGADSISNKRWDRKQVLKRAFPYLNAAKEMGCRTFFDCTPEYIGRDPLLLKALSDSTGLNIVTNTGYYGAGDNNKFLPAHAFTESADELAARWIDEWNNGIDGTGIKPGFIKIGVGSGNISELHRKLVKAAARTHLKTGLAIASHTGPGIPAFAQLGILDGEGVSPEAFIWVHAQSEKDSAAHIMAARMGAWISFDGINENNAKDYAGRLKIMKNNGLLNKVLLSHDSGWYDPAKPNGGDYHGYTAVFQKLLPLLRKEGFSEKEIHQLLVTNPARAFTVKIRRLADN